MHKTLLLLCVATLLVGSSGCGCCRGLFGSKTTVAKPVFAPVSPSCNACDACSPCNSCNSCGDASYSSAPAFGYPSEVSYPMMPMNGG